MDNKGIEKQTLATEMGAAVTAGSLRENAIPSLKFCSKFIASSMLMPKLARFINKFLRAFGIGASLNRYDSTFAIYSSRKDKRLYTAFSKDAIFVNFGSGAFQHPLWKNFDYPGISDYYKSIQGKQNVDFTPIDLCEDNLSLPFDTNSVSLIYCSHTLEHLEKEKAMRFLKECGRVLHENGVLRLVLWNSKSHLVDAKVVYDQPSIPYEVKVSAARHATSNILSATNDFSDEQLLKIITNADFVSENFFSLVSEISGELNLFNNHEPASHISHWSHEILSTVSQQCGFKCYLPSYRGSSLKRPFKNLEVFDSTEPHIAIYGEYIGRVI